MHQVDVAVIGGGAAGISAARWLSERNRSIVVIEALPRLGGRAFTASVAGHPMDFGCEWLHSSDINPLAALATDMGIELDRRESAWNRETKNHLYTRQDRDGAWSAYEAFVERLHHDAPASDCAGDMLPKGDRWRPFIDALSGYINGVELDDLSIRDFLAYDDAATELNWRPINGYGAFIAALGQGLPLSLETTVSSVTHESGVVIETNRGTVRAKSAIVTVSTSVLASGAIRFTPAVDAQLHAASVLPLGIADKVFLSLADPDSAPIDAHLIGSLDRAATASYFFRPYGRPVIECYLGGTCALDLERESDAGVMSFVTSELTDLLGAEFAHGLSLATRTRWGNEPTFLGSYSHALPRHADQRKILATPVSEHLCFAGEACAPAHFSTAHGAWESGIVAAQWIGRHLPNA
jgi:monoamine oxidase